MAPPPPAKAIFCLLLVLNGVLYASRDRFGSPTASSDSASLSHSYSRRYQPLDQTTSLPLASPDYARPTSPILRSFIFDKKAQPLSPFSSNASSAALTLDLAERNDPAGVGSTTTFPFPGPPTPPPGDPKRWVIVPPLLFYAAFLCESPRDERRSLNSARESAFIRWKAPAVVGPCLGLSNRGRGCVACLQPRDVISIVPSFSLPHRRRCCRHHLK